MSKKDSPQQIFVKIPAGALSACNQQSWCLVVKSTQTQVSYNKSVFTIKKRAGQEGKIKNYGFPFARE